MPNLKSLPAVRCALLGCLLALVFSPPLAASDKRITTPLALPFQQAASAHSSSAASSPAPSVQAMPFTQRPASSPAAQALPVQEPPAQPLPVQAAPPTAQPVAVQTPGVEPEAAPAQAASSSSARPVAAKAAPQAAAKPAPQAAAKAAAKPAPASKPAPAAKADAAVAARPAKKIPLVTTAPIAAPRYPAGHPEAFVSQFEDYIAKQIAPYVPGVAVVIVSQGQIKSLQAYGVKRAGTREKMTPDTVFRLASVSKPVAATATAIMVQEGQLSWDSKVVQQLPHVQFRAAKYGNQLTLRHLLSQSVGLPTHTNTSLIEAGMSYAEAVRRLRLVNFVCPPGKCYAYQNITYSLAGDMVSKQYGKPFEDYVEDKLFAPLNMRSASFGLESFVASPNRASPHVAHGKRWVPTHVTPNYYRIPPAAGANASIVDMSRFLLAQLGKYPQVLEPTTLKYIQGRITKNSPAQNHYGTRKGVGNTAYGMGWRVFDYGRYKNFAHHGGWVKGFRSEMVFNRELGIGMVFLTNSESRLARNVIFKFMDLHEIAQQEAKKARQSAAAR